MKTARILLLVTLPALLAATASIIGMLLLPDLPQLLAAHWGVNGTVDRADSLGSFVALVGILVGTFTLGAAAVSFASLRQGTTTLFARTAVGLTTWFGVFISLSIFLSIWAQRGVTDPFAVSSGTVAAALGVGFAGAAVAAALAVLATPKLPQSLGLRGEPANVPLGEGERVYWAQTARSPRGIIALPIVLGVGITVLFAVLGIPVWFIALVALVLIAVMTTLSWRVVVDQRGLTVTGLFGFPRFHVPQHDIVAAAVIEIVPLRDYGGWGIRTGRAGNWGVVTRAGEAIEVQRRSGANFVVTVDDAATGAGLLTSLARRTQS
jgi:hypothetical protein